MIEGRLADLLDQMREAAEDARRFVEGLSQEDFRSDRKSQKAVVMSLLIVGEAAARVMDDFSAFAELHPQIPWRGMRGMRNRIAHGYFDLDLDVVWDTVQTALPELAQQLRDLGQ